MKAVVEPLEGNKVKLSVEVDEGEFEQALDAAFRRMASQVRIPGFRPGKAPRKLLESRIGKEAARQEALREALPDYYAQALRDTDVDAIAPPEIDITSGEEEGPIAFDAVVEVRPTVSVAGYQGLRVTIPAPEASDADVDAQVDRLRNQFAELTPVSRPAKDDDHVSIDLKGYRHDEVVGGLTADDFLYEVGSGTVVPELDEHLRGAKVGDILKFNAPIPGEEEDVTLQVLVKDVKEKVLPEVTDEWAGEASEFETVAELRDDIRKRMEVVRKVQAQLALRDEAVKALVELVADDMPDALVGSEMDRRLHDLAHRLEAQGADLGQYLAATGKPQEEFVEELKASSSDSVKADLALRAVADAEGIEVSEEDLDEEIVRLSERFGQPPGTLRDQLERADQMAAVRSDLRKAKALEWLLDHVEVVDEEGHPIDRAALTPEAPVNEENETPVEEVEAPA
ncbi:MAG: trigger factor [Actinobacteria bacterium]|nr:trigger factor [Actinomycetota bacterium]